MTCTVTVVLLIIGITAAIYRVCRTADAADERTFGAMCQKHKAATEETLVLIRSRSRK